MSDLFIIGIAAIAFLLFVVAGSQVSMEDRKLGFEFCKENGLEFFGIDKNFNSQHYDIHCTDGNKVVTLKKQKEGEN